MVDDSDDDCDTFDSEKFDSNRQIRKITDATSDSGAAIGDVHMFSSNYNVEEEKTHSVGGSWC